jgi:hypothetical protein
MVARASIKVFVTVSLMAVVGSVCAADAAGRVCVATIPTTGRWQPNDSGATESSTFMVQIDQLPPVQVRTNTSGVFTNLSLAAEHAVKVRLDGKPVAAFRFSFKGRGEHLQLWYNPFYDSWSLSKVRPGDDCACPKAGASNKRAGGDGGMSVLFPCRTLSVPPPLTPIARRSLWT